MNLENGKALPSKVNRGMLQLALWL